MARLTHRAPVAREVGGNGMTAMIMPSAFSVRLSSTPAACSMDQFQRGPKSAMLRRRGCSFGKPGLLAQFLECIALTVNVALFEMTAATRRVCCDPSPARVRSPRNALEVLSRPAMSKYSKRASQIKPKTRSLAGQKPRGLALVEVLEELAAGISSANRRPAERKPMVVKKHLTSQLRM